MVQKRTMQPVEHVLFSKQAALYMEIIMIAIKTLHPKHAQKRIPIELERVGDAFAGKLLGFFFNR